MRQYSRFVKVGVIVVGLLAVIAATNSLTGTSSKDKTSKADKASDGGSGGHHGPESGEVMTELPDPMGSPDAPVKIQVYMTTGNECDTTTLGTIEDIHEEFGDKVYVQFADLNEEEVKKQAQQHKIGCKTGLTINGRSKFILPELGLDGTIMLDGPIGVKNYKYEDIVVVVKHLLANKGQLPEKSEAGEQDGPEQPAQKTQGKDF